MQTESLRVQTEWDALVDKNLISIYDHIGKRRVSYRFELNDRLCLSFDSLIYDDVDGHVEVPRRSAPKQIPQTIIDRAVKLITDKLDAKLVGNHYAAVYGDKETKFEVYCPPKDENEAIWYVGRSIHMALRKCCDSISSSALYNLIHLTASKPGFNDAWGFYCASAAKWLRSNYRKHKEYRGFCRAFATYTTKLFEPFSDFMRENKQNNLKHAEAFAMLFHCIIKQFSEGDWYGYSGFLGEYKTRK